MARLNSISGPELIDFIQVASHVKLKKGMASELPIMEMRKPHLGEGAFRTILPMVWRGNRANKLIVAAVGKSSPNSEFRS